MKFVPFSLNVSGRLVEYTKPAVMGIVNVTPDSFYGGSRTFLADQVRARVEKLVAEGADFIDIGAYSSRPGADEVSPEEELRRIETGMEQIRKIAPEIPVSIDTFRANVAREAVKNLSVDIINDISGGDLDAEMFATVAELKVPYILMHMRGTPATMQSLTDYGSEGVTANVLRDLAEKVNRLALLGVNDIIIDPGFGFAKTLDQNYELLAEMEAFLSLECPILVGVSRKSMITRYLGITSEEALNGTTVINTLALERGAAILRVHDVKEAVEAVKLYSKMMKLV
ncbi:MAG: dihydropteroate synthase [Muribaculaceae bacterium]